MKKWNMIRWILGIPVIVLTLILVILIFEPEKSGITRAAAAKSVALALLSPEELNAWEKTYGASRFAADEVGEWYVPYLDYLYENDYLDEAETPADREHAEGFLTYREAARIAEQLSGNLKRLVLANRRNGEKAYPAEDWWLLYDSLLKEADREGAVHTETVCIYGTPENIQGCPAWTAYTSLGTLTFYGLSLDSYVDHELSVLLRDGELIHVQKDKGQNTLYRNVWILDGDSQGLMVYIGDIQRRIPFRKNYKKTVELIGNLADLTMDHGKITKVSVKKERISGKVLSVQAGSIELEGYGTVPLDTEYKVLKTYGDVKRQQLSDILVGSENQEFIVAKGKICAAIKEREDAADRIRVLIMGNGFESRYHEKIEITCPGSIKKIQGDSETMLDPASVISVTSGDGTCSERLILEPQDGSELTVNSLVRAQGTPSYGGRLEILDTENGLVLVNEIDMEEYLKKVIPSEMPSSYEKEAPGHTRLCRAGATATANMARRLMTAPSFRFIIT